MQPYKRTQIGYLTISIFVSLLTFFALMLPWVSESSDVDAGTVVYAVMILVLAVVASFWSLTVAIDDKHLSIKFGFGIFKKKFALSEVVSVKAVKNHWYYGWGIRVWFWPHMWIFNVSGFDAVEIVLRDGKIYRIGTDVPTELELAIRGRINAAV